MQISNIQRWRELNMFNHTGQWTIKGFNEIKRIAVGRRTFEKKIIEISSGHLIEGSVI